MNQLSEAQKKFCEDAIFRLNKTQVGHFLAFERLHGSDRLLGLAATILTSVTSMLIIFNYNSTHSMMYDGIVLTCSVLATLATSMHAYLNLEDRAMMHKNRAYRYGALKRRIETFLALQNEHFEQLVKSVETEWNHIASDAPVTPVKDRKKAKFVIQEDMEDYRAFFEGRK